MANKRSSFFWTSYSDLMTALFFVMFVLFAIALITIMGQKEATERQLNKIKDLQKSIETIDSTYFTYNKEFKRHTIKRFSGRFSPGSSDMRDMNTKEKADLREVGESLVKWLEEKKQSQPDAEYMLIIEGQSSKDGYKRNYELSYERALALVKFWRKRNITFDNLPCELIISGSGDGSEFRDEVEKNNQRFVIHIIPKPGNFDD